MSGKTVGKNTPKVPATINAKKRNVTKFPKTPKHKLAHGGKKKVKKWMKKYKSQTIIQLRFVLGWDGAKSRALGERGLGRAKIY